MLIAVDIGNSSISIGYFAGGGLMVQKIDARLPVDAGEYAALVGDFMGRNSLEKEQISCIISSVVPGLTGVVEKGLAQMFGGEITDILTVSHRLNCGLEFDVEAPEEIGADRIANAVAACNFYSLPVAVVDFGTASTVTVVDAELRCLGGSIMPGLGLMNDILEQGTSGLKKVLLEAPERALGANTAGCIRAGLFFGTAGGVERILSEIESETGCALTVVITGGYGPAIERFIRRPHHVNSHLTLLGLKLLHEKNRRMV
ncbi:MAG: type III pantothenate kinase [Candidatus Sulfobium sp.]